MRLCRNVWLNQYSSQLLPIVALIGLRVFVGLGDRFLRLVTKPKKDPMQASGPLVLCHFSLYCHYGQDTAVLQITVLQ